MKKLLKFIAVSALVCYVAQKIIIRFVFGKDTKSVGIIGGADGPTAIYLHKR